MALDNLLNYLKRISEEDKAIQVNQEEIETALSGERIPTPTLTEYSTITVELLKLMTDDNKYYKQVYSQLVEKSSPEVTLRTTDEIGFRKDYDYNKFKIIDAAEWAINNNRLNLDEVEKLKILKMSAEFQEFVRKYSGETQYTVIEGNYVSLPIRELIDVMTYPKEDIEVILLRGKHNGLTIEELMYSLDVFLDENKIMDKYYIPDSVRKNIEHLRQEVDITYINRCLEYQNNYLKRVEVNDSFRAYLLSNLNPEFDTLQKAFCIYYKMCNSLTYDQEQYARREDKDYEIKHHDISRIKEIDQNNNRVVCYEFNAIYASLLKDLGLKFELEGPMDYAKGHAALIFRADKFIVRADSTVGLIKSDLAYAKNGLVLTGFTLENNNRKTYEEFVKKIDEVYYYLSKNNEKKYSGTVSDLRVFEQTLPKDLDLSSKTKLFVNLSLNSNLPSIDKIPYELKLKKVLFEKDNMFQERFTINYISKREVSDEEHYGTTRLITFNDNGVDDIERNNYIAINSNNNIEGLSYSDIEYRLMNGEYKIAQTDKRVIPGFNINQMIGIFEDNKKTHR